MILDIMSYEKYVGFKAHKPIKFSTELEYHKFTEEQISFITYMTSKKKLCFVCFFKKKPQTTPKLYLSYHILLAGL